MACAGQLEEAERRAGERLRQSADDLAGLTEEQEATVERLRHEFTDRSGPILPQKRPDKSAPQGEAIMR
jgi:hypothetical protein